MNVPSCGQVHVEDDREVVQINSQISRLSDWDNGGATYQFKEHHSRARG